MQCDIHSNATAYACLNNKNKNEHKMNMNFCYVNGIFSFFFFFALYGFCDGEKHSCLQNKLKEKIKFK